MTPRGWPCPLPGGGIADEYVLTFDRGRAHRLLIVPALFDEGNRMRRLTVEVMRRLDGADIDCFLPDLPGTNESLQDLALQSIEDWSDAMQSAARAFAATHVLAIRGGCLFAPPALPGWFYAPTSGSSQLRTMLRARVFASREAGMEEMSEELMARGVEEGLELAGYRLGADFLRGFRTLEPVAGGAISEIAQDTIGGTGLWRSAEPGESATQADALAAVVAMRLAS